jgi:tRNA(fMet)-specific endonuclease VapC
MYLLDTDTVIHILKGDPVVEVNLKKHIHDPIKIGTITLMELYYGAYKSQKVTSNLAKIRTLENALEVIPIGEEIAEIFGREKARLEKGGNPLDDFDLVLGCCALSYNLTLVTNNIRHFRRIEGLQVANWIEK